MLEILTQYREAFLSGAAMTLKLAAFAWAIGIFAGVVVGVFSSRSKLSGAISFGVEFLISSTPVLVLLFWFHFPAQQLLSVVIDPFWTSLAVFSAINTFFVSGIVRNSAKQIPREFIETARVYGISAKSAFLRIEFPLILRGAIPSLLTAQVTVLHMTLFASLISVDELFRAAQRVNSIEYRPVEIYTIVAIFYLAISLPLNALAIHLRSKYSRDFSER